MVAASGCFRYKDNACMGMKDGVAKSPSSGVTAFFQDLDILTCMPAPLKNHQAL
jgi:hypothetical protein